MRAPALLATVLLASACAPPRPAVQPGPTPRARLAAADALVRAGCLDCLVEAMSAYGALRSDAEVGNAATIGEARAAALVSLRERDLGLLDSHTLDRARALAASTPDLQTALAPLLDIVESIPARRSNTAQRATDDETLAAMQKARRNRDQWQARLRGQADEDAVAAYLWVAFNCFYSTPTKENLGEWLGAAPSWRETPLVEFEAATCGSYDVDALRRLIAADSRFKEVQYIIGLRFTMEGKLDDAAIAMQAAYEWRPRWPALTYSMATVYLTAEDFAASADFFDRTLQLVSDSADALLGKAQALTYLGRHEDALKTLDDLLALGRWHVGEARYWRALNEAQLERYDDAWSDVELAAKLLVNADVPKLAGIIAYRRRQLDVSRAKFEEARQLNPADCEIGYYLQIVLAEQGQWAPVADVAPSSAVCFDEAEAELRKQIANLRARTMDPAKQARQIAKREQTIAVNGRMRATCWFNATVAAFNLHRADDARRFADKVADDEQFRDRVKDLLARLR